jgi:Glyoxalase-like domain
MPCKFTELVIDSTEPRRLAEWWAAVLGYSVTEGTDEAVEISGGPGVQPTLVFVPVPEPKLVKNRLHIDLNASDGSTQKAELQRLLALGARHADVGQQNVSWHVLADPEGNEFCLLRSTR